MCSFACAKNIWEKRAKYEPSPIGDDKVEEMYEWLVSNEYISGKHPLQEKRDIVDEFRRGKKELNPDYQPERDLDFETLCERYRK